MEISLFWLPLWDSKSICYTSIHIPVFLFSEFVITLTVCNDLLRISARTTTKLRYIRHFDISVFILKEFYCIWINNSDPLAAIYNFKLLSQIIHIQISKIKGAMHWYLINVSFCRFWVVYNHYVRFDLDVRRGLNGLRLLPIPI